MRVRIRGADLDVAMAQRARRCEENGSAAIGLRVLLLLLLMRRAGSAAAAGVAAMRLQDSDSPLQLLRCATNVLAPAGRNIVRATRSMMDEEGLDGWVRAIAKGVNLWLRSDGLRA